MAQAPRRPRRRRTPPPAASDVHVHGGVPCILCLLPRGLSTTRLGPLLKGYCLESADTWARAVAAARRQPCDLYLVQTPLDWADAAEVCRKLREADPQTPLVVYSTLPGPAERREMRAVGVHAYLSRGDDAQNLAGTVGQLVMLAELRSMEARESTVRALRERADGAAAKNAGEAREAPTPESELKTEARRLFATAGGSAANFERMWPAIYEDALSVPAPRR